MSRLGQLQPAAQPAVVGQFRTPPMFMYYGPRFIRNSPTAPGQPYKLNVSSEEAEQEIYKDLPTDIEARTKASGASPEKLVRLKTGLEVPVYLVERDIERKKAEKMRPPPPPVILPFFHKLGVFASDKPMQASAAALVLGAIAGHFFYDFQNK